MTAGLELRPCLENSDAKHLLKISAGLGGLSGCCLAGSPPRDCSRLPVRPNCSSAGNELRRQHVSKIVMAPTRAKPQAAGAWTRCCGCVGHSSHSRSSSAYPLPLPASHGSPARGGLATAAQLVGMGVVWRRTALAQAATEGCFLSALQWIVQRGAPSGPQEMLQALQVAKRPEVRGWLVSLSCCRKASCARR